MHPKNVVCERAAILSRQRWVNRICGGLLLKRTYCLYLGVCVIRYQNQTKYNQKIPAATERGLSEENKNKTKQNSNTTKQSKQKTATELQTAILNAISSIKKQLI